jgi:hypothetical protein
MSSHIANAGCGLSINEDSGRTLADSIKRPNTNSMIADSGGWRISNNYIWRPSDNWPSDMRNCAGNLETGVHVGNTRRWRHGVLFAETAGKTGYFTTVVKAGLLIFLSSLSSIDTFVSHKLRPWLNHKSIQFWNWNSYRLAARRCFGAGLLTISR